VEDSADRPKAYPLRGRSPAWAGATCGGSRAKPRECGPLTEANICLPKATVRAAPSAGGFAADLGDERDSNTKLMVDLATRFWAEYSGLRDTFFGLCSGLGDTVGRGIFNQSDKCFSLGELYFGFNVQHAGVCAK
jgi:hypothetical protein